DVVEPELFTLHNKLNAVILYQADNHIKARERVCDRSKFCECTKGNARVCDRHFSESCFSSTLRERLNKFAHPQLTEDLPSTASDNLSALPSPAFHCPSVEVNATEHSCSRNILSSPISSHNSSGHLQVTSRTRKIKTLLPSVSKLRKRL
ncbi:hypothetical protein AVEN_158283-1, partial [Araneus ventricosus]